MGVFFVVQSRVEACVVVPQTQVQGMGVKPKTPAEPAWSPMALSAMWVQSSGSMSSKDKYSCTDQGEVQ